MSSSSSSISNSSSKATPAAGAAARAATTAAAGSPAAPAAAFPARAAAIPPPAAASAMVVEMDGLEDHHHSDTSSATDSISHSEIDANFNAALYSTTKQKIFERTFVVLAQLAQLAYLSWRWYHFCITKSTLYVSLPFIISETLIVLGGSFITYFLVWNQCKRPKLRLVDLKLERKELPTVDVMIPCYNEPVEIVRQTTLAALNMDYPKEKLSVIICDDGNSAGE